MAKEKNTATGALYTSETTTATTPTAPKEKKPRTPRDHVASTMKLIDKLPAEDLGRVRDHIAAKLAAIQKVLFPAS